MFEWIGVSFYINFDIDITSFSFFNFSLITRSLHFAYVLLLLFLHILVHVEYCLIPFHLSSVCIDEFFFSPEAFLNFRNNHLSGHQWLNSWVGPIIFYMIAPFFFFLFSCWIWSNIISYMEYFACISVLNISLILERKKWLFLCLYVFEQAAYKIDF